MSILDKFLLLVCIGRAVSGCWSVFQTYKYLLYDNYRHGSVWRTLLIMDMMGFCDDCDAKRFQDSEEAEEEESEELL